MLDLSNTLFDYAPYPIGLAKPAIAPVQYAQMVASFPPLESFATFSKGGSNKYHLSEKANAEDYHSFIRDHPIWRPFYDYIKSPRFIRETLSSLDAAGIKLGLEKDDIASTHAFLPTTRRISLAQRMKGALRALLGKPAQIRQELSARFEFSALPSDGGNIQPHTDHEAKVITLVISILEDSEWESGWGGGTEVLECMEAKRSFNHLNDYVPLDDCRVLKVFEFTPNQCVIFVKTFNSLHAVRPMRNKGGTALRRTLTVNIERSSTAYSA